MARYPSLSDYNAALLSPRTSLYDPILSRGRVEVGGLGMPLVLSGGFALTYRLHCPGKKQFAVRCFQEDQPGREERYRILIPWIRGNRASAGGSGWWVDTEYQPEGIRINGGRFPIVKMDWVSGKTLGALIEERHGNAAAMDSLRRKMRRLAVALGEQQAAHGDVQNGNVLWTDAGLKLIDYDGMFAPGMEALSGSEAGHPNFQHPGRKASDFGPEADRFSFILYDISLHALSRNPGLYEKFSTGENVLFSRSDLQNPADSPVFSAVEAEPGMEREAPIFRRICAEAFAEVPRLSEYLLEIAAGKAFPIPAQRRKKAETPAEKPAARELPARAARPAYEGPYPVYSARDYSGLRAASGRKVEVVGRVEGVKQGLARNEKPYVFINFGPWREDIFRITIWSEGLESFRNAPDDSLVGEWISVVGLVDPPYTNEKFGYTHAGVTVHHPSQMRTIGADESAYRLGKPNMPGPAESRLSGLRREGKLPTTPTVRDGGSIDNRALIKDMVDGRSRMPRVRNPTGDRSRAPRDFKPPQRARWLILRIAGGALVLVLVYLVLRILLR